MVHVSESSPPQWLDGLEKVIHYLPYARSTDISKTIQSLIIWGLALTKVDVSSILDILDILCRRQDKALSINKF
jgi:hypothetical protein